MIDELEEFSDIVEHIRSGMEPVRMHGLRPHAGRQSSRLRGPALAIVVAVVLVALVGLPSALTGRLSGPPSSEPHLAAPASFPYLGLDRAGLDLREARDVTDPRTGELVGVQLRYYEPNREILLRVHRIDAPAQLFPFPDLEGLLAAAASEYTASTAGLTATVYLVPDEVIEEGTYDQAVIRWMIEDGYTATLIAWGSQEAESLEFLDFVVPLDGVEWQEMIAATDDRYTTESTTTATSMSDDGPPETVPWTIDGDRLAAEYLADLPLPPGHDVDRVLDSIQLPTLLADEVADAARAGQSQTNYERYQLGAGVAGRVTCLWIDYWIEAKEASDDQGTALAIASLATSRSWPVLIEMEPLGSFSSAVWEYADAVAGGGTVPGGRTLTVEESYRATLGC